MATDLTAILVREGEHDVASVRGVVAAGGYGNVWLRVQPLPTLGLIQVEVCEAAGLPCVDPALVHALSGDDKRAVFVHVNQEAKQAVVHAFHGGEQLALGEGAQPGGWLGEPPDLDGKLAVALGRPLAFEALIAADDGTRRGLGTAASSTVALVRARPVTIPRGAPTMLGTFSLHDAPEEQAAARQAGEAHDRVVLLAFDDAAARTTWQTTPARELALRLQALSPVVAGPLAGAIPEVCAALLALGDAPAAELRSVPAHELVALAEAYVYAGGSPARYLDERFLPMFTLSGAAPVFEDEDDDELEARASVLEVMVEVLPFTSPEGSLLEQLGDDELAPLAPWAERGAEYVGSLFRLKTDRLLPLLRTVDDRELAARVDTFYRAWWRASYEGTPEDFAAWRKRLDETGAGDVERFLRTWAEWRTVLEIAAANGLQPALLFYGA